MTDFSRVDLPWSPNADLHWSLMGGISLLPARLPVMRHTQTGPHNNIVSKGTRGQGVIQIEFCSIRQNLETLSFSFFGIQLEKTE